MSSNIFYSFVDLTHGVFDVGVGSAKGLFHTVAAFVDDLTAAVFPF